MIGDDLNDERSNRAMQHTDIHKFSLEKYIGKY